MASLPVTIFRVRDEPYENWQKLAWAGVFLITLGVLGAEHPGPRVLPQQALRTTTMDAQSNCRSPKVKISVRDLNFFYGSFHALKNINLDIPSAR